LGNFWKILGNFWKILAAFSQTFLAALFESRVAWVEESSSTDDSFYKLGYFQFFDETYRWKKCLPFFPQMQDIAIGD
jgi:hypothetical protein